VLQDERAEGMVAVEAAAKRLREASGGVVPRALVVLGSGLAGVVDRLEIHGSLSFGELPGFADSSIVGHSGRLVFAKAQAVPLLVMQGRLHLYEGHSAGRVVLPVRAARLLGAETLVVTNAAGGLDASLLDPGDIVLLRDQINLQGTSPLLGPNLEEFGPRFPVMSEAFDGSLRALAHRIAGEQGVTLKEGVYAGVLGPAFETPAEVDAIRSLGADVVGMSTVAEVIAARHCGMRVLGLSLCTNVAGSDHGHEEVLAAGDAAAPVLGELLAAILAQL
jgi:purine-nucleoside phosphorylase